MSESPEPNPEHFDKDTEAALLRAHLARAKSLRKLANQDPASSQDRMRLREFQSQRLARTHHDLLESQRYGTPAAFFLTDLYGPKDFSARDEELERILPMIVSVLPAAGVHTVGLAVEVDALSEELDAAMVGELRRAGTMDSIDDTAYGDAYRACARRPVRERQIALIGETGRTLARLTHMPFVSLALTLMRTPAHLAGLGELHEFLDHGFSAFKHMGDPSEFLELIRSRETVIMERLFAGHPEPFAIEAETPI